MPHPIIIIPDLHGREFWRKAVKELPEDTRVVFLGDYLDPYESDWIYWTDAFKSLQDIITFKKAHAEQVTLLWGNHDLHYLFPILKGSRYNAYQAEVIRNLFEENLSCFQMAAEYVVSGKHYLFSHAGVHPQWLKKHSGLFGPADEITADTFNRLMFTDEFVAALSDVSVLRGGKCSVGSMIWEDIDEFAGSMTETPEIVQICGHTKCADGQPKAYGNVICMDCQKAFVLTEEGFVGF
jgi:hypothetical protein